MNTQLSQKEQELLVLEIVDACIQYSEEKQMDFARELEDLVFVGKADTRFSEMVCKTIESLHSKKYIAGTVELVYETEMDIDTFEESTTDDIDFSQTIFENISITAKGRALMGAETFKEAGKSFMEKVKPVIKCIASTALQTAVETAIVAGMKAAGIPV
mgnify:FL=1